MIELKDISFSFGKREILRDVDLTVQKGETMVILGASGVGKSTVLKLIIGLMKPTSGEVYVRGEKVSDISEKRWNDMRRHMGMVFQYSALFDSMTVKENVAFGLRQHTELSEDQISRIVQEKLHLVGLDGIESLMPSGLSGGMKKRVSLARAIALNPEIILYDEPTAGLDPIRSADISLIIKSLQSVMGVTSVVVTHDLQSARMIADRVAYLYEGNFLKIGTMEELEQSDDERVRRFMQGESSLSKELLEKGGVL